MDTETLKLMGNAQLVGMLQIMRHSGEPSENIQAVVDEIKRRKVISYEEPPLKK
jgi:hypothetical protein